MAGRGILPAGLVLTPPFAALTSGMLFAVAVVVIGLLTVAAWAYYDHRTAQRASM